jgi:hypothetical protein
METPRVKMDTLLELWQAQAKADGNRSTAPFGKLLHKSALLSEGPRGEWGGRVWDRRLWVIVGCQSWAESMNS